MHKRLALLLTLIILLPLAILVWLGISETSTGNERLQLEVRRTATLRTERIEHGIRTTLMKLEAELRQALSRADAPAQIRDLGSRHPLARASFQLDAQGRLRHPDTAQGALQHEREFLQRTRRIWSGEAHLDYQNPDDSPAANATAQVRSSLSKRTTREAPASPSTAGSAGLSALPRLAQRQDGGWIPWFWEDGLQLLYWIAQSDGGVRGLDLERIALLSRVVAALPELEEGGGTFSLVDESGREMHRFGLYPVEAGSVPLVRRSLPSPLQHWTLEYRGPEELWQRQLSRQLLWDRLLKLGLAALGALILGIIFLRESTRSLREARERVDFVNQVSHELKTPLTNIRLYAELLEDEIEEVGAQGKLRIIRTETERLSRMIRNVLTFARRERNTLSLHRAPVFLDDVVREVLDSFGPILEKRGIALECNTSAPTPVELDRDAAGQILANLIGNAEKYGAEGKILKVHTGCDAQGSWVRVCDAGPGIPAPLREKIFRPFFRASDKVTEGVSGAGIGLAIARHLAMAMGGSLVLENPGAPGACFLWHLGSGTQPPNASSTRTS